MVRRPHFLTMSDNAKIPLQVVVDSREQCPFTFEGLGAVVEVATLQAGDYSVRGFENRVALERKSLDDLLHSISTERERFSRELQRLKACDAAAVIVESPAAALRSGRYRSRMDPASAWQTCVAFMQRFRVAFIFCESRQDAERVAFDFLRHFHRDRIRELEALRIPARIAPERQTAQGPGVGMDRDGNAPERRQRAGGIPHPTTTTTGTRP